MPKKYIITVLAVLLAVIFSITLAIADFDREELPKIDAEVTKNAEEPFCLLVLGKDRTSGLTDVMMLVSLDIENERISVMQIPRDTYADYGNKNHKKLNSAAGLLGGEKELCEFLSNSFGVRIDGYLSLELDAFRKAVDAVGGVPMYIPKRLYYNDPAQKLYIDIPAGEQVLDGKKAEMLVRYRTGYAQGDLDRIDMQKRFLASLFSKLKSSVTADNAYDLVKSVFPHVKTNVTLPLAVALGLKSLSIESSSLCFMTLPGEAVVGESGASFYVMSAKPAARAFEKYFSGSATVDKKMLFRHTTNKKFSDIYSEDFEYSVVFGNEIE